MHCLQAQTSPASHVLHAGCLPDGGFGEGRPYAVYDASHGDIVLKESCWRQQSQDDGLFYETLGIVTATAELFVKDIAARLQVWCGTESWCCAGAV